MKKLLFALMAFVFTTSHAQEIMKVVMSDGTTNSFEVKKIQKVVFEGQEIVMTTGEVTNITTNSAQFSYSVSGISKVISTGVLVSTSNNLTYDNFQTGKKKSTQEDGTYSVSIDGLSSSTTYYYRAFAKVGEDYVYGAVRSFKTTGALSNGIYKEPYTNWGATMSMTKSNMSSYTLYKEETSRLTYFGNDKEVLVMFNFDNNKLFGAVVVVTSDNATMAQLDEQLQSRSYVYLNTASDGAYLYLSTDGKTVAILQYNSELSAYYIYYYDYDWFMSSSPALTLDKLDLKTSKHSGVKAKTENRNLLKSLAPIE